MLLLLPFVLLGLLEFQGAESSGYLDYDNQGEWPELCLNGQLQSPIDIPEDSVRQSFNLNLNVPEEAQNATVMVANDDDHAIKVAFYSSVSDNNTFDVPIIGDRTTILQTHLHWGGSEHMIGGHRFQMECHLVTATLDASNNIQVYAVFARLFELGEANPEIQKMIDSHDEAVDNFPEFNLAGLFPSTIDNVYQYNGSLTTPPCTENVRWFVVADPLTVSQEQLTRLAESLLVNHKLEHNFRETQSTNGRRIVRYSRASSGVDELSIDSSVAGIHFSVYLSVVALLYAVHLV